MKTENLIENLSLDLKTPSESRDWFVSYWMSWVACAAVMALVTWFASWLLPAHIHLPLDMHRVSFWIETASWFGISFVSGFAAYSSSIPGRAKPTYTRLAYVFSFLLMVSYLIQSTPEAFAVQVANEAHLLQGPCGVFIALTGLASGAWMLSRVKRAAPVDLAFTATWTATSVGAMAAMFMHLVCSHENPAHLLIWHVFPLVLLILIASAISQRVLRW
jgi:hypothetical protein